MIKLEFVQFFDRLDNFSKKGKSHLSQKMDNYAKTPEFGHRCTCI